MLFFTSSLIPIPVSSTISDTSSWLNAVVRVMAPPSGMACRALIIRLEMTWSIWDLFAVISGRSGASMRLSSTHDLQHRDSKRLSSSSMIRFRFTLPLLGADCRANIRSSRMMVLA